MLEEAVRVAELQVGRFTGLPAPADVAQVHAVRRAGWVNANAENLKTLLEPAARQAHRRDRTQRRRAAPAGDGAALGVPASALAAPARHAGGTGPRDARAAGARVNTTSPLPRSGPGQLLFVVPNLAAFERDWSLDPREFRTLVALHEVTHRFEFAQGVGARSLPGAPRRLPLDAEARRRRDAGAARLTRPGRPEALPAARRVRRGPVLGGPRRRAAPEARQDPGVHGGGGGIRRPRDAGPRRGAARDLPPDRGGDEAVSRGRARRPRVRAPARRGHEARAVPRRGGRSARSSSSRSDEATLARMWESADAMPSLPELEEPRLWLARTV